MLKRFTARCLPPRSARGHGSRRNTLTDGGGKRNAKMADVSSDRGEQNTLVQHGLG